MTMEAPMLDVRKVTVIPKDQWNRIQARLAPRSENETRLLDKIQERERLHQKSIEVVKNWSNTIQGQRQKKLEARRLRLDSEEVELQKIDAAEAKFQQARRQMLKDRDAKYDSAYIEQYKTQTEDEFSRRNASKGQALAVADYQRQQRQNRAQKLNNEILADIELGKTLKANDDAHKHWLTDLKADCRKEKKQLMNDIRGQISQKERIRHLDHCQEVEEDNEILLFDKAKNLLKDKRKNRELEIMKQIQKHREIMCNNIENVLLQQNTNESKRIEHYQEQSDKKDDERKIKKQKTLEETLASIKNHRLAEIDRFDEINRFEDEKNEQDLKNRIEIDNDYLSSEKDKEQERQYIDRNITCDLKNKDMFEKEEKEFQNYADEVIGKAKERKANIFPLIKAARPGAGGGHGPIDKGGVRPSFLSTDSYGVQLPTYQKGSTDAVKGYYSSKDMTHAKKRFGFV